MQYQEYPNQPRQQQVGRQENKGGSSLMGKILGTIIKKVILSPLVVLIIAYFYFDQDLRKAFLAALYFFTALTIISIVLKLFSIFTSAMTFNLLKFVKKSIDLVVMLIGLVIYWFLYSLYSGANFSF